MNRTRRWSIALALLVVAGSAHAAEPTLIPRELLFGNPERESPQISPDAKRLAWLAPDRNGVLQVWVQTIGKDDAKPVSADEKRGIRTYSWAQDANTVLYLQDAGGDENFHVYGVDLGTGNVRDYTPFQGVRAAIVATSHKKPHEILVSMNLRKRELFDVHRVDLRTGAVVDDTENPGDVRDWVSGDDLVVRGAIALLTDGRSEIRVRDGRKGKWKPIVTAAFEDEVVPIAFSADGKTLYLTTSIGADTSRLVARDLRSGKEKELARHDVVDLGGVEIHPTKRMVQAASFIVARTEWKVLDPSVQADFDALARLARGDFKIVSRDRADQIWLVAYQADTQPASYWTWDRAAKKGTFLFAARPALEDQPLSEMKPIELQARDGLTLRGYLTLPHGSSGKNLPTVLFVHGGPWTRDLWQFSGMVQWLANRGYAVLQINFRGSAGYGQKFLHAGDKQWGLKMHDDLIDAVDWAIAQGVADPKRVAILGGSYGGYAALAGAAFTPDTFRCAIDVVGPSNLFTLLSSIPPYWKPLRGRYNRRVGDPDDPADKKLLERASPLFAADKIKIPLLIAQGANDPRVKPAESEQIVAALEKRGGRVTYVLYPDEGHGFARPENRLDFNARAEAFLGECLGGRVEPLAGDKIPGSTAIVKVVGAKKKK